MYATARTVFTAEELYATCDVPAAVQDVLSIHPTPRGCVALVSYPYGQYVTLRFRDGVAYCYSAPQLDRDASTDAYAAECVAETAPRARADARATA